MKNAVFPSWGKKRSSLKVKDRKISGFVGNDSSSSETPKASAKERKVRNLQEIMESNTNQTIANRKTGVDEFSTILTDVVLDHIETYSTKCLDFQIVVDISDVIVFKETTSFPKESNLNVKFNELTGYTSPLKPTQEEYNIMISNLTIAARLQGLMTKVTGTEVGFFWGPNRVEDYNNHELSLSFGAICM
jgi:hypothetical protein